MFLLGVFQPNCLYINIIATQRTNLPILLKFADEERKKKAGFGKAPIKKGTNYDTDNDGIDTEGKTLNKLQFF